MQHQIKSRPAFAIAAVIALGIVALKTRASWYVTEFSVDGGFYADVARNILEGHGIQTNISLYHKGMPSFPHPTAIYPLWPMLLAAAAWFSSLTFAAVWLPTVLYFASVGLAFLWGRALWPSSLFSWRGLSLNGGHVLALMLALNKSYFSFTSMPYSEGLGFTLLFLLLWRSHKHFQKPGLWAGVEMGFWLGLMLLTRSQLLLAALALFAVQASATLFTEHRGKHALMLGATVLTLGLVLLPEWLFIRTFLDHPSASDYINFAQARPSRILSPVQFFVRTQGLWDTLKDRLQGVPVAFSFTDKAGYFRIFYLAIWLIPLAALAGLWRLKKPLREVRVDGIAVTLRRLHQPQNLSILLLLLLAAAHFLSLHMVHKAYFSEWHFARRHAIGVVFMVFAATIYLLNLRKTPWKVITAIILLVSLGQGLEMAWETSRKNRSLAQKPPVHRASEGMVADWLNEQARRQGPLVVAVTNNDAQRLVWRTEGVGFHWVHHVTTAQDMAILVQKLGIQYLIARLPLTRDDKDSRQPMDLPTVYVENPAAFAEDFEAVETQRDIGGFAVFRPRKKSP